MNTLTVTQKAYHTVLEEKIRSKTARIGIVGLGYTGLPLAVEFAKAGFKVTGIDINLNRVTSVLSGESYLEDITSEDVAELVRIGMLDATVDFSAVRDLDVLNICVPTPLGKTREPDLSYVESAANGIAQYMAPGKLVVLESTTFPGTTEEVVKPILEESGLKAGEEFFLAYSPERVDPGNPTYKIKNTPKIVAGYTDTCRRLIELAYQDVVDTIVPVSSMGAAELAKLLENIFRNVNIALVNELALICERFGLDVWEVVDAAATKPFGFMKFYPGPGLGGHCIPVDPFYLSWKAREYNYHTEFIELAGKINEGMPYYVVTRIADALNSQRKSINGSKILLMGAAYKKDISDVRESPIFNVVSLLEKKGAQVDYHDPHVATINVEGAIYRSVDLEDKLLTDSDCVVILTDHSLIDYERVLQHAQLIIDTRNALHAFSGDTIFKL